MTIMRKMNNMLLLSLLTLFSSNIVFALSGKAIYTQSCVACHGNDGKGSIPGAPDFTSNKGPLNQADNILLQRTIKGYQSPGSSMAMPPRGGNSKLTNTDLQNAIIYIRQSFGQKNSTNNLPVHDSNKIAANTQKNKIII